MNRKLFAKHLSLGSFLALCRDLPHPDYILEKLEMIDDPWVMWQSLGAENKMRVAEWMMKWYGNKFKKLIEEMEKDIWAIPYDHFLKKWHWRV